MSLACSVAASATVYKWVDEDGVVHYSDQPHENAEKVQLKAPQTYSAPPVRSPAPSPRQAMHQEPAYQSCTITEPANDQVFMNTSTVTAGASVQPALRPGDQLVVTLDGQRIPGVPSQGGGFTISPVDRGSHELQAVVQDSKGQTVCQSPSVTFHVRQPTVLAPNPAVRPKF
jgi:hypothetical protein